MNNRYLIRNLSVPLSAQPNPLQAAVMKLRIAPERLISWDVVRKAIDARQKQRVRFNFSIVATIEGEVPSHPEVTLYNEPEELPSPTRELCDPQPFIIGMGPAGLFSALALVERGFKPILFDRGEPLEARRKAVGHFWGTGMLDPESNVQFGEGGAGAFSDGKLTARNRTPETQKVFDSLIRFGASPDIAFEALPHVGTDMLETILLGIRRHLIECGAEFRYGSRLDELRLEKGRIVETRIAGETYRPEIVILAIGNGAHDTFQMLLNAGVRIVSKPYAIGMRIEHRQDFLNNAFYGTNTDLSLTGPATYRLTARAGERGVYSFCMCPGGQVVAAASENEGQVLNGMSYHARDGHFGNSAIVVTVGEDDFGREPLAGIEFRRRIERAAFDRAHPYHAPAQPAAIYVSRRHSALGRTSYRPGVILKNLEHLFPSGLNDALRKGLTVFDRQVRGFIDNGILLAPETRTSSPVRIIRHDTEMCSLSADNLFPIGEGAGYAGGIVSSAVDGYRLGSRFRLKS